MSQSAATGQSSMKLLRPGNPDLCQDWNVNLEAKICKKHGGKGSDAYKFIIEDEPITNEELITADRELTDLLRPETIATLPPDKLWELTNKSKRLQASGQYKAMEKQKIYYKEVRDTLSEESIERCKEQDPAGFAETESMSNVQKLKAIVNVSHGLIRGRPGAVKLDADKRVLNSVQGGGSIATHNVLYRQRLLNLFSVLSPEEQEIYEKAEISRERFFASLNEDFEEFPTKPEYLAAVTVDQLITASELWYAKAMAALNTAKYRRLRDTKTAATVSKAPGRSELAMVSQDQTNGESNKSKAAIRRPEERIRNKSMAQKPEGGRKVYFDPANDTVPAPKGKFRGASAKGEIGAKVGYEGEVCNDCVREMRAGRKVISPIAHSWATCFNNPAYMKARNANGSVARGPSKSKVHGGRTALTAILDSDSEDDDEVAFHASEVEMSQNDTDGKDEESCVPNGNGVQDFTPDVESPGPEPKLLAIMMALDDAIQSAGNLTRRVLWRQYRASKVSPPPMRTRARRFQSPWKDRFVGQSNSNQEINSGIRRTISTRGYTKEIISKVKSVAIKVTKLTQVLLELKLRDFSRSDTHAKRRKSKCDSVKVQSSQGGHYSAEADSIKTDRDDSHEHASESSPVVHQIGATASVETTTVDDPSDADIISSLLALVRQLDDVGYQMGDCESDSGQSDDSPQLPTPIEELTSDDNSMPSLREVTVGPGGVVIPVIVPPDTDEDLSDDDDIQSLIDDDSDSDQHGNMSRVWQQMVDQANVHGDEECHDKRKLLNDSDSDESDAESIGIEVDLYALQNYGEPVVDPDDLLDMQYGKLDLEPFPEEDTEFDSAYLAKEEDKDSSSDSEDSYEDETVRIGPCRDGSLSDHAETAENSPADALLVSAAGAMSSASGVLQSTLTELMDAEASDAQNTVFDVSKEAEAPEKVSSHWECKSCNISMPKTLDSCPACNRRQPSERSRKTDFYHNSNYFPKEFQRKPTTINVTTTTNNYAASVPTNSYLESQKKQRECSKSYAKAPTPVKTRVIKPFGPKAGMSAQQVKEYDDKLKASQGPRAKSPERRSEADHCANHAARQAANLSPEGPSDLGVPMEWHVHRQLRVHQTIPSTAVTLGMVRAWLDRARKNKGLQGHPYVVRILQAYFVLKTCFGGCIASFETEYKEDSQFPTSFADFDKPEDMNNYAFLVEEDDPSQEVNPFFMLDSGATRHLFNMNLLADATDVLELPKPVRYTGIGEGAIVVKYKGDYGYFRKVHFSSDPSQMNLVSMQWMLQDGYNMEWNHWASVFKFTHADNPDNVITFRLEGKLWVYRPIAEAERAMSAIGRPFTDRERAMAVEARRYHELTGHRGRNEEDNSIRRGSIQHCNVTGASLRLADALFGPCPVCVLAKSKKPNLSERTRELTQIIGHTQHVDVFFIFTKSKKLVPVFIFVDEASNRVNLFQPVENRRVNFELAVRDVNGFYLRYRHHSIKVLYSDNEGSVHQFEDTFKATGGQIIFKGAGEHVSLAERYIGVLKEIMRTIVVGLPYTFPISYLNWLIKDAAQVLSMRSNPQTNGVPVCEFVDGWKPDFNRMAVPFGAFGLTYNPKHKTEIQDSTKSQYGIVVKRPLFGELTYSVMPLGGGKVLTRKGFKVMPMPPLAIATVNKLSPVSVADYVDQYFRCATPKDLKEMTSGVSDDVEPPTSDRSRSDTLARGDDVPSTGGASTNDLVEELSDQDADPDSVAQPWYGSAKELLPRGILEPGKAYGRGKRVSSKALNRVIKSAASFGNPMVAYMAILEGVEYAFKVLADSDKNISIKVAAQKYPDLSEASLRKEIQQLLDKDTFEPRKREDLTAEQWTKVIMSFTFSKPKRNVDGQMERLKARLVAGGHMVDTEDLGDIASPTGKTETLFLLHALAAYLGWKLKCLDIPGAYLNTRLPEDQRIPMVIGVEETKVLIMLMPQWAPFVRKNGTIIVLLKGGLYGLPQAALLWYERLCKTLFAAGYHPCEMDRSCFVRQDNAGSPMSIVLVHVDDLAHFHVRDCDHDRLVYYLTKDYGEPTSQNEDVGIYTGVEYAYDREDRSVRLTMHKYTNKMLEDLKIVKTFETPSDAFFMDVDEGSPPMDQKELASIVMSIYYLAMRTRPDVLFHVTFLATRICDARQQDLKKVMRVLGYILLTKERGVVLRVRGTQLVFSIDASYAIHPGARSHAGLHITLGDGGKPLDGFGGPIMVRSHVIKLVVCSSFEAEIFAVHKYRDFVFLMRSLMCDFGFDQSTPSILLQDNQAVILVINRGQGFKGRTKFIDVRVFQSCDNVKEGVYTTMYCPTEEMPADPPSKPLHEKAEMYMLVRLCNDK